MGMYGSGMGIGGWLGMGLFWIALIALIIWLVTRLLPSNRHTATAPSPATSPSGTSGPESPFEILDRRLTHGDIDVQTYQAHRLILTAAREGN